MKLRLICYCLAFILSANTLSATPESLTRSDISLHGERSGVNPLSNLDNEPPVAQDVVITGSPYFQQRLQASYSFFDVDDDPESGAIYQWYRSDSPSGEETPIASANLSYYDLTVNDLGKYISVEVTPVAATGTSPGLPVRSGKTQVLNEAPKASSPGITGIMFYKQEITAYFIYSDLEGDAKGSCIYRWYRADNASGPDEFITESTSDIYVIALADVGKYISFEVTPVAVTGTNPGISVKSSRVRVENAAPVVTNLQLSGNLFLNQEIIASYSYSDLEEEAEGASVIRWYRADDAAGPDNIIAGATQKKYIITSTDLNKYISFEITPHALTGTSPGTTRQSARIAVQNAVPVASSLSITGNRYLHQTLTANYAFNDLENDPEGSSIFRWYRADYEGGAETQIPGATQKNYVLSAADLNKYISFEVVPVAVSGSTTGTGVRSVQVQVLNEAPGAGSVTVSGSMYLSQTITGNYDYSDLEGDAEGQSIYRWYRSDSPGGVETEISGATQKTYTITTTDLNRYISFEVIPVAVAGSSPGNAVRSARVAVLNAAPTATSLSITGNMYLNQVITAGYHYSDLEGDQEGTSLYRWLRSDDDNGPDVEIAGAVSKTYTITAADLNKHISFEVRPVAQSGTTTGAPVQSSRVAVLNAVPVVNSVTISGNMYLSQTITGNYNYSDLESDHEGASIYKWYRADNASGPDVPITGATQKTYVISSSDLNKYLSFEVTPVAVSGSTPGAAVKSTRVAVLNEAPSANSLAVTGSMYLNQTITAGYIYSDLESDAEGSSIFQWYRADNTGGPDVAISGATQKNYTITAADLNKFLSFTVTPVAASGTVTGTLKQSSRAAVLNAVPVAQTLTVSGNRYLNQTVTASYVYSDLENDPEGSTTCQWFQSGDINGPDVAISGATQKTFVITSAYLNKFLSFEITPVATTGSPNGVPVRSQRFAVLNAVPVASLVSINGSFRIGQVLQGVYTYTDLEGDAEAMSAFNWYRANTADGSGKTQIIGANTKNYVVQSVDMNKYISFEVIPVAGSGSMVGNASASPFMGPVENSAPTATNVRITGTQAVCKTLRGEYDYYDLEGDPEGATAFRWLRAASVSGIKTPIAGATGREYTLTVDDQGMIIFFEVLPRAVSGSTTGTATIGNPTGVIVNLLPTVTFLGTASICNGSSTKLTISFTGSPPWKLTYTDGNDSYQIVSGDPVYLLNVSKGGTYKGLILEDNINCPVTNLPSSATISILPLPAVDIVGLNSAYNFRSNPVQLTGNPTGGTFTGPGVISSTSMFYPSIAGTQNSPHTIIYEYKSPTTGCTNRDTAIVEVIDAEASISGLRSAGKYCNFDTPFTLTGTNVLGTTGTFAISGGVGLTDNQNNTATINPALLAAGNYIVTYSYFDGGIQLSINRDFTVEVFEEARIFGLNSEMYCKNNAPVELSGNYSEGIFTGNAVVKNASNKYFFNPALVPSGSTTVNYSYTTSYGCVVGKSVEKVIAPVPDADFSIVNGCYNGDSTQFRNKTVSANPVTRWDWRFGDLQASEADNRSALFEPRHKYPSIGNRNVRLIAENSFGCRDTAEKTIHLGDIPVAGFYWGSECFEKGTPVSLKNNTTHVDELVKFHWEIEDTSKLNFVYSTKDVLHTFPLTRNYLVKFKVTTEYGCSDSIKKVISMRPEFPLKDNSYANSFENGKGFWLQTDTVSANNWRFGTPAGTRINSAYSGTKSYYTSLREIRKNQQLIITSPCFDFSETKRPYISLATFTDAIAGQEGAVLQYSTDGVSWENIGAIGSGKDWYNDFAIQSQPGGQLIGWSDRKTAWTESSHDLDVLTGKKGVRFRVVFGQSSKTSGTDGFAFDNIYIGTRNKFVLFEHFTNNSQISSLKANALLDSIVKFNPKDVVSVQYHTSFPGVDTFNMHNPSDPGSRVLYYGIGNTPLALLEGGLEADYIYDFVNRKPNSKDVKRVSLKNAGFDMSLQVTNTTERISGTLDITSLRNLSGRNISARIIVVEDILSQVSGEKVVYRNVVKKILPSAGGTVLSTNWTPGKTESVNFAWDYRNVYNPKNIQVVAFLQDELSKEIYQVVTTDTSDIINSTQTSIRKPHEKFGAVLYPNPARDWIYIDFAEPAEEDMRYEIRGADGKQMLNGEIFKGVSRLELDIESLRNGIYFLRIMSQNQLLVTKKVVVIR